MRIKILCGILALMMITAGVFVAVDSETPPIVIPPDTNLESTLMERPADGDPSTLDAKQCLYIAAGELKRSGGFKASSNGASTSMGVSQAVASQRTVVGDNSFKQSTSYSALVKFGEQLYCWEENYLARSAAKVSSLTNATWANTAIKYDKEGWLKKIGYRNTGLSGYILNDKTIVDAKLESEENGIYTFRYVLDTQIAPYYVVYEMCNNAGAKDPSKFSFSKAEVIVTMDKNFQVNTFSTDCEYKVPLMGGVNCKENLTETFFDIGYNGDLPEKEFFEGFFDAEIVKPEPIEPTALDVLMDMFAPYVSGGQKLNASAEVLKDGQKIASALISAKLDIENVDNIAVDVKLGEGLYLSYVDGKLFVIYQDFKASTTLNGVTDFASTLTKYLGASGTEGGITVDAESLLANMSFKTEEGVCTVSLPLELDKIKVDVNLIATVEDGTYTFAKATASFGDVLLEIAPVSEWQMPELSGEYPELLGLTQIIRDGKIALNAQIGKLGADVSFDIATTTLNAKLGDVYATLQNNLAYLSAGGAKIKLDIADVGDLTEILKPIVNLEETNLPSINLQDALTALRGTSATATERGVVFSVGLDSLNLTLDVELVADENGWNLQAIVAKLGEIDVTVTPIEPFEFPEVGDVSQYVDATDVAAQFVPTIVSLINAKGYSADFALTAGTANNSFEIAGSLLFDQNKNVAVDATVYQNSTIVLQANVIYGNDTVFLTANGIKVAFSVANTESGNLNLDGIAQKLNVQNAALKELIAKVKETVAAVKSFDVNNLDIASLAESLSYQEGTLRFVANGNVLSLGKIDVEVSTVNNALQVELNDFEFASLNLNLNATVGATENVVTLPDANDYVLNLETEVAGIGVTLSADILNMDIAAKVSVLNDTIDVRFVDDAVYAKLGNVAVKLTIADVTKLLEKLNLGDVAQSFDVAALLAGLKLDLASDTPNISITSDKFAAALNFTRENNISFGNVTATIAGQTIVVEPTSQKVVPLDVTGSFLDAAPLLDQILNLVETFKKSTGINANLKTQIEINGKSYTATVALNYNKGLHAVATISDQTRALAVLDVYYVNNTLFVDANGLRAAVKTETLQKLLTTTKNDNKSEKPDAATVIQSIKGLNSVLDSVADVVLNVLNNYKNIVIADVVKSVSYDDGILVAALDGGVFGLSQFDVTVDCTSSSVTFGKLTVGKVTIQSLGAAVAVSNEEVVAPIEDYTTDVKLSVANVVTAELKLDLLNLVAFGKLNVWNTTADVTLNKDALYLACGETRLCLALDQIDDLISEIQKFANVNLGGSVTIDVASVLNSLTKTDTEKGYKLGLSVGNVNVLLNFENTSLRDAVVSIGDVTVSASLASELTVEQMDTTKNFVNAVTLLQSYSDGILQLINANGYKVTAQGSLTVGGASVGVDGTVVLNKNAQGGVGDVYAKAALSYNNVKAVNAEVWLVRGTLYASVDGIKLAIKLPSTNGNDATAAPEQKTLEQTLAPMYGYKKHLDAVLDLVKSVAAHVKGGNLNLNELLKQFEFVSDDASATLTAVVDGAQLGEISQFSLGLTKNAGGFTATLNNLAYQSIALNLSATIAENSKPIALPDQDWSTNLLVKLDDNTLFANLDLLNGIYKFKLGELNVMYSDNTIKVHKGADIKVLANVDVIGQFVERIDEIVKQFGSKDGTVNNAPQNGNNKLTINVKEILNTLQIASGENFLSASLTAMNLPVTLDIVGGEEPQIAVTVKIDMLKKEFVLKPNFDNTVTFDDFADTTDYIAIDKVLQDYIQPIDALIHTNSWRFDFNQDSEIVVKGTDGVSTTYVLASGSFVEFYYNTTCKDMFTMRAYVDLKKVVDGKYNDLATLDAMYQDGRIYLTYNNQLKATVSIDSIKECASLVGDLRAVIPQIDELIASLAKAKDEAEGNAAKIDYSAIIQSVRYENEKFSITLNASMLLSDLGDIVITASKTESTMTLECLQLSYGENNPHATTVNVTLKGVTVSASELTETQSEIDRDRYAAVADINDYFVKNGDIDAHMRFDSLKQLLSAVVTTADDTTFAIDGTAIADLSLIGIIKEKVTMPLSARVDIIKKDANVASTEDTVFVTVKLSRPKQSFGSLVNVAFDDYGGDSYLYFDGEKKTITIIRNSYKLDWGIKMKERDYVAENVSVEDFSANAVNYILEMVNFSNWVNDLITKPSDGEGPAYGLEDIFKWYSYSQEENKFALDLDLKPLDSNLGTVNLNILHKIDKVALTEQTEEGTRTTQKDVYTLTNVNGNMKLLKEMMTLTLNLNLDQSPVYGDAKYFVQNTAFWSQGDHSPTPIASK